MPVNSKTTGHFISTYDKYKCHVFYNIKLVLIKYLFLEILSWFKTNKKI